MADSKQDDWADALSKLAGGDVAPSEHEPAGPVDPPAAPARSAPPRAVIPPQRPAPRPSVTPSVDAAPRPQRPATPSMRPAVPTARVAPSPAVKSNDLVVPAIEDQPIVMDDDSVIMDAPDASVFAPKRVVKTAKKVDRAALYRTIGYRQTLIPILLTCGVVLLAFSTLRVVLGPDSALADLPGWLPAVLAVTGLVLLGFAGLNMVSVKAELGQREVLKLEK